MKNCDVYNGDCYRERNQRLFGCGFVVSCRLRQEVLSFQHVSECLITFRIKGKFANISLICAHALTEEKDDATKESLYELHDTTSGNELRLIDFAAGRNVTIASTRLPHLNVHKGTWRTPDQQTVNQIDHVAIDVRQSSSILDVRIFQAADIDSDHYLVAAKVYSYLRISQTPQQRWKYNEET